MACGLKTLCTDLPGIRPWLDQTIPHCGTLFVEPPRMFNEDEPYPEDLPEFELRLARALEELPCRYTADPDLVRQVSWNALCEKLISIWNS